MTIEEIEAECAASQTLDFSRHSAGAVELPLSGRFYSMGFPMDLRTNSPAVLDLAAEQFGMFEKQYDTEPVHVDMYVAEGGSAECPPPPTHSYIWPMHITYADADNFKIADIERQTTYIRVTRGAIRHKLFVGSLFLASAASVHFTSRYLTTVHAACVVLDEHGILLCGDSGAGKSTLAYACSRAGFKYVTDDGSFLLNGATDRVVLGNCHQVRFRPTAAELFPELHGQELTPRLVGKPSIELPTTLLPHMVCTPSARVDFIVFLNRRSDGPPQLVRYSKDVARYYMRQAHWGTPKTLAVGYETIERLLTLDVFELRYTDLDWAIERLKKMAQEGQ